VLAAFTALGETGAYITLVSGLIRILTITTLTILLFLAVFYSTWTILKTATRTGE
jgi:hypothetical protein